MSLINITRNADLRRVSEQLEDVIVLMSRLTYAVERIAGPELPRSQSAPYKAGLSDLRRVTVASRNEVQEELSNFAENKNVVLDSEAFYKEVEQYENEIADAYGEDALLELPWNKKAGGLLFRRQAKAREDVGTKAAHSQPAPRGEEPERAPEPEADPPSEARKS